MQNLKIIGSVISILALAAALPAPSKTPEGCPVMSWTTLGTAGGPTPAPDRAEPSNLLLAGGQAILVDTGDGTVNQLAKAGIPVGRISAVFISHHHMDHTGGLGAVIGLRWMTQAKGKLTVYGPQGTKELVDGIIISLGPQSRLGKGGSVVTVQPQDSVAVIELDSGQTTDVGPLKVTAAGNSHFYHPEPPEAKEPVSLSYRFQLGTRSITYTGDTGPSDAVSKLAEGSQMFVSEVGDYQALADHLQRQGFMSDPKAMQQLAWHLKHHHVTGDDVGQMAAKAGVGKVVLTHYVLPPTPIDSFVGSIRLGVTKHYAGPMEFARDLSQFSVPCQ